MYLKDYERKRFAWEGQVSQTESSISENLHLWLRLMFFGNKIRWIQNWDEAGNSIEWVIESYMPLLFRPAIDVMHFLSVFRWRRLSTNRMQPELYSKAAEGRKSKDASLETGLFPGRCNEQYENDRRMGKGKERAIYREREREFSSERVISSLWRRNC